MGPSQAEMNMRNNENVSQGFNNLARSMPSAGMAGALMYRRAEMQQIQQKMQAQQMLTNVLMNPELRDGNGNIVKDHYGNAQVDPQKANMARAFAAQAGIDPENIIRAMNINPGGHLSLILKEPQGFCSTSTKSTARHCWADSRKIQSIFWRTITIKAR